MVRAEPAVQAGHIGAAVFKFLECITDRGSVLEHARLNKRELGDDRDIRFFFRNVNDRIQFFSIKIRFQKQGIDSFVQEVKNLFAERTLNFGKVLLRFCAGRGCRRPCRV